MVPGRVIRGRLLSAFKALQCGKKDKDWVRNDRLAAVALGEPETSGPQRQASCQAPAEQPAIIAPSTMSIRISRVAGHHRLQGVLAISCEAGLSTIAAKPDRRTGRL
jgi:hypothetical protein